MLKSLGSVAVFAMVLWLLPLHAAEPGLTLRHAVLSALERDPLFASRRLGPEKAGTAVDSARAAFDPTLSAETSVGRNSAPDGSGTQVREDAAKTSVDLTRNLPTGTSIGLGLSTTSSGAGWYDDARVVSRAGVTVSQSLLRGLSIEANLASLRQARVELAISCWELAGYAQSLVAEVETSYWAAVLARQEVALAEQSQAVTRQQVAWIQARIAVGTMAASEAVTAQAEAADREKALIDARAVADLAMLRIRRLVAAPEDVAFILSEGPVPPASQDEDEASHRAVARSCRPDLNQARLALERNQLEVVKTKNGLLPRLDLFATLGRSGYADSFGPSWTGQDGTGWDAAVGLRFTQTLGRRAEEATARRATLARREAELALANQERLADEDIRAACLEIGRARAQIPATAAARQLRQEQARLEQAKLAAGSSTALAVAQAERDLSAARLAEVRAVRDLLLALIDLHLKDGSLLARRGIDCGMPMTDSSP